MVETLTRNAGLIDMNLTTNRLSSHTHTLHARLRDVDPDWQLTSVCKGLALSRLRPSMPESEKTVHVPPLQALARNFLSIKVRLLLFNPPRPNPYATRAIAETTHWKGPC